ncbi:UBP-type zinc finger domain-containing protein [Chryseobacterium wangxinyae]|uniref:UBP-type zinc finger domain-containing protein n=1 Tax=Chryseobacterium sp. CY350 TaxID=2997336 RepID=UPI0022713FF5|nr:UBP-type zinc finger domain-containing protein [Chryseobacterium sp. CY350]MCY0979300.1 UBP-type zinc finger domain-containing protein [Chryseobacterium sp. CY350]WBZ95932.1 UBP-type zinc finger domain-containing protein [Chryseobacterium sp. CY350]
MENNNLCDHITSVKKLKTAQKNECSSCIEEGTQWVHLRTCQTCGTTLCCDSSPMQHMSHHCKKELHPVVISSAAGEQWMYCYVDDIIVEYS